nr:MAG TPA: hypothetical protein [Caudoviricetes sp.]
MLINKIRHFHFFIGFNQFFNLIYILRYKNS